MNFLERVKVTEWLEVNRYGEGFSIKTGIKYKPEKMKKGYLRFSTRFEGKSVKMFVHRAVALAFIPNPENKPTVNHKNAITNDNCETNLEWATYQEQQDHVKKMGLRKRVVGEDTSNFKYPEKLIREICTDLENGLRNSVIVKKYGVDVKLPSDIRNKRSWVEVSADFNIQPLSRGSIDEDTVHIICQKLQEGWLPSKIIRWVEEHLNQHVTRSKVKHIKSRNAYKHISVGYEF